MRKSGLDIPVSARMDPEEEHWNLTKENAEVQQRITDEDPSEWQFPQIDVHAPALIVFISGSTGRGKGVVLSQYNVLKYGENYRTCGAYRHDDQSSFRR